MKAIKLKPENFKLIQTQTPQLRRSDLEVMYQAHEDLDEAHYFVPDFEDGETPSWGIVSYASLEMHYMTDHMDKIHDQFVEIRHKRD